MLNTKYKQFLHCTINDQVMDQTVANLHNHQHLTSLFQIVNKLLQFSDSNTEVMNVKNCIQIPTY